MNHSKPILPFGPADQPFGRPGRTPFDGFGDHIGGPFDPFAPLPAAPNLPAQVQAVLEQPVEHFLLQRNRSSTNPALTHAALLLDESSSMHPHRGAALEGYNAQVGLVCEGAREAGNTRVTLTVFNSYARRVLAASDVEKLTALESDKYRPSGGTALYDALGETIAFLLSQPGSDDPNTAFLVAAFTDGEENSSRTFSGQTLKDLITRLEATGRWTFTLMGPQGGADEMAKVLNIPIGNVASFNGASTASVNEAFGRMAQASATYMNLRANGVTASASLYASEDDQAGSL
ncbi:von Willebrand factor type A domain protein [compost metagenome]